MNNNPIKSFVEGIGVAAVAIGVILIAVSIFVICQLIPFAVSVAVGFVIALVFGVPVGVLATQVLYGIGLWCALLVATIKLAEAIK